MADTTTKGFPYPEGPDAVDVPGDIQALAEAVDDMPGIQSYTSTEIAGLAVGEKWAGRVVWNSTAGKLQVSNGSTFSDVDTSVALSSSTPQTLGTAAAGTSSDASRADHRHAMPSASDVGAIGISLVDARGDLVAATANDTPARLAAGSNGQMLMADSSATAGLRYVDPPANRNLIINGACNVHQRSTSVTGITNDGYRTADRFLTQVSSAGTWTQTVENDAPAGSGLRKSLKMTCTTADSSLSASDRCEVVTVLEGQDLQRIRKGSADAQQLSLSFWAKSNVTGTYTITVYDFDNNRMTSFAYTIAASATWERKVIVIPADTTGSLDNDNAASLGIYWELAMGSNFTGGTLASSWQTLTDANRAVGQVNLAAATNNYWQITGVQLETGIATPFEFEPYEATLRKCQRYYQKSYNVDINPGTNTSVGTYVFRTQMTDTFHNLPTVPLKPAMRATPTITLYSETGATGNVRNVTDNANVAVLAHRQGQSSFASYINNVSVAAQKDITFHWVAEIEL